VKLVGGARDQGLQNLSMDDTPKTIVEAFASPDADDWKEVVRSEMDTILFNGT
jgi:hypothetical protein